MWSVQLVHLFLAAILYSCVAQDYDDWVKAIENEDDLGKESLTFNCSDYPNHPRPTVDAGVEYPPFNETIDLPEGWMFPNLTITYDTGDLGGGKYHISIDHQQMTINNVDRDDFGVYHCMVKMKSDGTGRWYLVKWGVNMRGPYFENLWDKYRTNTIIAFSASGGFTAFMIIICLVYQYRWQPPGSESSEKDLDIYRAKNKYVEEGVVNKAFTNNLEEPTTSVASTGYQAWDKPPIPSDGISASPNVTYSTFTPDQHSEVEADTRF